MAQRKAQALLELVDATGAGFASVEKSFARFRHNIEGMGDTFRTVLVGTGFFEFGRRMLMAASEAEQASAKLQATLRATGHAAGFSKAQLDEMAESMAGATQFDDESIRGAQASLLKFGNIYGEVFKRSLALSADLAAFLGVEIPEAAQMLGKSVQSPTEGLTMMERQFGKLTEAEEKHINELVRQGKAIEAQQAVLDLWQKKIGGAADAMNIGLAGAAKSVNKEWGELLETMGKTPAIGGRAERTMQGLAQVLRDVRGELEKPGSTPLSKLIEDTFETIGKVPLFGMNVFGKGGAVITRAMRARAAAMPNAAMELKDWMEPGPAANVILGGKQTESSEAARTKALREMESRAEKAVELEEMAARDSREAWEFYTKGRLEQEERLRKEREAGLKAWFETIDMEQEEALRRGEEVLEAERARRDALKDSEDAARQLGLTFSSAMEDAIVGGKKASEVIRGIAQDILRIFVRKTITEPMAGALSEAFKGMFAGMSGRAMGGPVFAGVPYMVGERGPELFVPRQSGSIVAGATGSVTLNQTNYFESGLTAAQVEPLLRLNREQTKAEIENSLNRGSRRYAPR